MNFRPLSPAATALLVAMSFASTASHVHAQVAGSEAQAQLRFARGREFITANNHAAALTEFRAANALLASPNTRLYIARCLQGLGRSSEAFLEFQRAAAEAADRAQSEPRYAATRDNARTEMEQLRSRIGTLNVHVPHPPEGLQVFIGDVAVSAGGYDLPVPTDPGQHVIRATAPGMIAYSRTATVTATQNTDVIVELQRDPNATVATANNTANNNTTTTNANNTTSTAPQTRRVVEGGAVRIVGVVVAGVGLGGMGAFAAFGNLAQARYNALRDACGVNPCDPSINDQIDEGASYQRYANIGLGVGLTSLAAGITMIIVGGPTEREVPVVAVHVTDRSSGLTVSGRF